MGNEQTPGRVSSTRGVTASTAPATASKARASRAGSCSSSSTCGQRAWASRRRRPVRIPSARAAGVVATTRLACRTTAGTVIATPAATSGQSAHHTTIVRTPPPFLLAPDCGVIAPQSGARTRGSGS